MCESSVSQSKFGQKCWHLWMPYWLASASIGIAISLASFQAVWLLLQIQTQPFLHLEWSSRTSYKAWVIWVPLEIPICSGWHGACKNSFDVLNYWLYGIQEVYKGQDKWWSRCWASVDWYCGTHPRSDSHHDFWPNAVHGRMRFSHLFTMMSLVPLSPCENAQPAQHAYQSSIWQGPCSLILWIIAVIIANTGLTHLCVMQSEYGSKGPLTVSKLLPLALHQYLLLERPPLLLSQRAPFAKIGRQHWCRQHTHWPKWTRPPRWQV